MLQDIFDFDCPSKYVDISTDDRSTKCTGINDENWFFADHPLHEPQTQSNIVVEETENALKKRPSLLKTGGGVMRIAQSSRKSDTFDRDASQRAKANANPPLKTSVAPTTFATKSAVGSKRPLSQSQDSSSSEISKTKRSAPSSGSDMRGAKSSIPKNNIVSTSTKVNGGMSSKLEEYRQKKTATQVVGKRPSSSAAVSSSAKMVALPPKKVTKDDQDMLDILKKHNEKFAVAPLYEPSRHSVRDVRKWEKLNSKVWSSLSPEERETANKDITAMKSAVE
jgi:hypothetical protein